MTIFKHTIERIKGGIRFCAPLLLPERVLLHFVDFHNDIIKAEITNDKNHKVEIFILLEIPPKIVRERIRNLLIQNHFSAPRFASQNECYSRGAGCCGSQLNEWARLDKYKGLGRSVILMLSFYGRADDEQAQGGGREDLEFAAIGELAEKVKEMEFLKTYDEIKGVIKREE